MPSSYTKSQQEAFIILNDMFEDEDLCSTFVSFLGVIPTSKRKKGSFSRFALSANDQTIITWPNETAFSYQDVKQMIHSINVETGESTITPAEITNYEILEISITPDERHIVIGSYGDLRVYNFEDKSLIFTVDGDNSNICTTKDGNFIISGGSCPAISILNLQSGKQRKSFIRNGIQVVFIGLVENGETIVVADYDGDIFFINFHTGEHIATVRDCVERNLMLYISPNEKKIAALTEFDLYLSLWDVQTRSLRNGYELDFSSFSRTGTFLDEETLLTCHGSQMNIIEVDHGTLLQRFDLVPFPDWEPRTHRWRPGPSFLIDCLKLSNDGTFIAISVHSRFRTGIMSDENPSDLTSNARNFDNYDLLYFWMEDGRIGSSITQASLEKKSIGDLHAKKRRKLK